MRPGLDDKVLTEWNALLLVDAGRGRRRHRRRRLAGRRGRATASSSSPTLRRADGRWLRSWQADGGARHLAYAADHAALVDAFTRLAEATGEARWIDEAAATADAMLDLFWDDDARRAVHHRRRRRAAHHPAEGPARQRHAVGQQLAAVALLRLGALTGDEPLHGPGRATSCCCSGPPSPPTPPPSPTCSPRSTCHGGGVTEIAVVGDRPDLVAAVHRRYLPRAVLAWGEP